MSEPQDEPVLIADPLPTAPQPLASIVGIPIVLHHSIDYIKMRNTLLIVVAALFGGKLLLLLLSLLIKK